MKGQYFSFDAIIASVIFVLALVALLSYWHSVRSFLDYQNDPMTKEAIRISNLLFAAPTYFSEDHDCSAIDSLGFGMSWTDRRINESLLIDCYPYFDDGNLNVALNSPYMATLKFTNVETGYYYIFGYVDPPEDALHVVKIRRLGTVVAEDGSTYLATIDLTLYQSES